ncbi:MAG TPA: STAS domain-containing protein [Ignavibacteria bacterium]|nr:STAS domain-containing protein [Ignavibacteria bacterium]HQY51575.1 STAS domain-containing protein [Ignavibacteria bacterium]HRB00698.1 STAS domain-containing protein [Ignavibacteria bacterium]
MKFEIDKQDDKTIFKLEEKSLDQSLAVQLKTELVFLQKEINNQFIIDLKDVTKCDSSGLSVLLFSERIERDKERKLMLINVNKNVEDLMKIARLDRVFEIK